MPSSVVLAIHYDPASATLKIVFVSGTVYEYRNVPGKIYKAMKAAPSKGIYFNKHIKEKYPFEKIK